MTNTTDYADDLDDFIINPGDLVRVNDRLGIVLGVNEMGGSCHVMWCDKQFTISRTLTPLLWKVKS